VPEGGRLLGEERRQRWVLGWGRGEKNKSTGVHRGGGTTRSSIDNTNECYRSSGERADDEELATRPITVEEGGEDSQSVDGKRNTGHGQGPRRGDSGLEDVGCVRGPLVADQQKASLDSRRPLRSNIRKAFKTQRPGGKVPPLETQGHFELPPDRCALRLRETFKKSSNRLHSGVPSPAAARTHNWHTNHSSYLGVERAHGTRLHADAHSAPRARSAGCRHRAVGQHPA